MNQQHSESASRRRLQPSNAWGTLYFGGALTLMALALALSLADQSWLWLIGQILLALSFLQWFALLHEAGHQTLFRWRWANRLAGHIAGFVTLIPFAAWRPVHARHHRWTGWQDVDPTTATLSPRHRPFFHAWIVNLCWALWIPLFSIVYRIGNYWHLARLWKMFPERGLRWRILLCALAYIVAYAILLIGLGPLQLLKYVGLGLLLTLMAQDLLILSQHTHIPMQLSAGQSVQPFPAREQEVFTRSLVFPRWFSHWILLNLDAHELHHVHPSVPGYFLDQLSRPTCNSMPWWLWVWRARLIRGDVLLFQHRDQTGYLI